LAGDVLSQSEIDELLSALSTGTVSVDEIRTEQEQKKIKIYDFKRPDKFSKDQIRTLYMIHENFARLLNTYLSAHLRTMINIEVASVDQLTYEEFIRSLPSPSVIGIFQLPPLKGNAVFEMNPALVFAMIDRLFGGVGGSFNKARALTDIEDAIISRVMTKALDQLQEAWRQILEIEPRLETIESNPQFTQVVPPSDMVVIITLQAKIMQTEGLMTLCIPYLILEPIMSKLTTTFWVAASANKRDAMESCALKERLIKTPVPVSVVLGKTSINVQDLMTLAPGDVLPLDSRYDGELSFVVGQREKFKCRPGLSGKHMAVQVTRVCSNKGDDSDE
jgi:flagellar motor switch protein FliM